VHQNSMHATWVPSITRNHAFLRQGNGRAGVGNRVQWPSFCLSLCCAPRSHFSQAYHAQNSYACKHMASQISFSEICLQAYDRIWPPQIVFFKHIFLGLFLNICL
jgi:hypothetical protein